MSPPGERAREIAVVGAGIVGSCCALELLVRGYRVRLIDGGEPGAGTTTGSAGVISPWSCVPQALPGVWRSVPGWLLDPDGPVRVRPTALAGMLPWAYGFLRSARPSRVAAISDAMSALIRDCIPDYRRALDDTNHGELLVDSLYLNVFRDGSRPDPGDAGWRLRTERGASVDYVDAAELKRLEPALGASCTGAMVVRDQARTVSPGRLAAALADKARRLGARFERARLRTLRPADGGRCTLVLDGGERVADTVVLAAGIGALDPLRGVGLRLPLVAERGYHVQFPAPGLALNHSVMDISGRFVASSMQDGLRVAGTAEFASADAPADPRRARALQRAVVRLLPSLCQDDAQDWMGARPSFPDNLPAIGRLPGLPGAIAAFGHSHYGLSMAPGTARAVAALVDGAPPPFPLEPFAPGRFDRAISRRAAPA